MTDPKPLVLIVDDDARFRNALRRLLETEGLQVEGFASAGEFLKRPALEGPGCIILDLQMPGLDGLNLQAELPSRGVSTPIVFLTGHGDIPRSVTAIKAGAVDFLTKPIRKAVLLRAVRQAFERDQARRAREAGRQEKRRQFQSLTPREREVLDGVLRGRLNKQIAEELGVSEATIKVHRGRVMQKMRATSVAELIRAAATAGVEVTPAAAHSVAPQTDPAPRAGAPTVRRSGSKTERGSEPVRSTKV